MVLILIAGAAWIKGPDASDYAQHPTLYLTSVGMSVVLVAVGYIYIDVVGRAT